MAWTERYCSVAGGGAHDGTSASDAWTLAEAIAGVAAGQRVNVIAGTYTLAADATFATAGTTTQPIWWRGYHTAIGDLDNFTHARVPGTDMPLIDADTVTDQVVVSGAYQIFSNIAVTSICTDTSGAVALTGGNITLLRCQIENTQANSAARALSSLTTSPNTLIGCRLKATTTALLCVSISAALYMVGCHIIGGATGISGSTTYNIFYCVVESFATTGVATSSGTTALVVSNCSIYSNGATNGILSSGTPTTLKGIVANTIIGGCTNGINNSSGVDTANFVLLRNHFYSCTNNLVGITEIADVTADLGVAFLLFDDDNDPFTNKAANDFSLASGAIDKSIGYPGVIEGQSAMVGYPDIGAVRHQDPASSAGSNNFLSLLFFSIPFCFLARKIL